MTVEINPTWRRLFADVPRASFLPDRIWIDNDTGPGFAPVSRTDDPARWLAAVAADEPVVTQIDLGDERPGIAGSFPSSSCSQPSIVAAMLDALDPQQGDSVLEIGTGTGWNAALLSRRVGSSGRVVTVEIDDRLAELARRTLAAAGYERVTVVCADGTTGYAAAAPYDRVISTAAVRQTVPVPWLDQLRPGGTLVTPWGTDYANGALLTLRLDNAGVATGSFAGDVAFMRLRDQRRALHGWEPDDAAIGQALVTTTECRGADLDRMLDPAKGRFAIGIRLADARLSVEWDKLGERHHVLELDDAATRSFARLDADLTDPAPLTVYQLGPRRLWDEAETAYDWWHEQGEPGPERFGMTVTRNSQIIWLDDPDNVICRHGGDPYR